MEKLIDVLMLYHNKAIIQKQIRDHQMENSSSKLLILKGYRRAILVLAVE